MNGQLGGRVADRMPALDGIRSIAVMAVLFYHAGLLHGGFLGVDLFFGLSGFLITSLLLREIDATGRLDLPRFWLRRAFRLAPALIAYLLGGIVAAYVLRPDVLSEVSRNTLPATLGLQNWWLVTGLGTPTSWDGHLWSLSVEQQFYVVWPAGLIVLLSHPRLRAHMVKIMIGLIIAVIVWRIWLTVLPSDPTDPTARWYKGTDARMDILLTGSLLAVCLGRGWFGSKSSTEQRCWSVASIAGWSIVLGAMVLSPTLDENPLWTAYGGFDLIALAVAAVVGAAALYPEAWLTRALSTRPLVWLGSISYAFYLWHFPLISSASDSLGTRVGRWPIALAAAVLTAAIAQLSMTFVERPLSRLRRPLEKRLFGAKN